MSGDWLTQAVARLRRRDREQVAGMGVPVTDSPQSQQQGESVTGTDPTDPAELRRLVASDCGVPPEAVERLRGSTREELVEDAAALIAAGVPRAAPYLIDRPAPPVPRAGGVRGLIQAPAVDPDAVI